MYERFWKNVDKQSNGCWRWMGFMKFGRGRIGINNRQASAHRVSWIIAHGAIPDGADIRQGENCRDYCVNPDHLQLVKTKRISAGKMHCPLCGR